MWIAQHIDGLIMLAVGVWATGVGYGKFAFKVNRNPRMGALFVRHSRWAGPLEMLIALTLIIAGHG